VAADKPCAWQLIFKRLQSIGQLDRLEKIHPPKDWSKAWHGGARKIVRPEHRIYGRSGWAAVQRGSLGRLPRPDTDQPGQRRPGVDLFSELLTAV
jgi:Methylene-tetrahydrofolate reductase C terminal